MLTSRSDTVEPATTVDGLVRAAARLDSDTVMDAVRTSINAYGVARSWEGLIGPAWRLAGGATAAERVFSRAATQVLATVRRPGDRRPVQVLVACADEESHALPMEAFAAALAESDHTSCVLGARVPPPAIIDAVGRLHPSVVVVWSQTGDTADPRQIETVLLACPGLAVVAAGPGWDRASLPTRVPTPGDVGAALATTLMWLAGGPRLGPFMS